MYQGLLSHGWYDFDFSHYRDAFDICAMMCAGISGALVSFGSPLAAGSGIPEIKTYLNGVHVKGDLPLTISYSCQK